MELKQSIKTKIKLDAAEYKKHFQASWRQCDNVIQNVQTKQEVENIFVNAKRGLKVSHFTQMSLEDDLP